MEIRELTESDVDAFWELRLRALRDHPDAFGASYDEQRETDILGVRERFRTFWSTADSFIVGAFDPELIGMTGCFHERGEKVRHKASIWGVYVLPDRRGHGIARALLESTIERTRRWPEVTTVRIAAVLGNGPARSLYISLGFSVYGVEPRALKLPDGYRDEELMARLLR